MQILALVTAVQVNAREVYMLIRRSILRHRLIRDGITAVATIGAALLFS
jgi:hypothetical protein